MLENLVMTVIGRDRPGLVKFVAAQVAGQGGNWLESRMARLGGQFAGILRIEAPADRMGALVNALRELEKDGLQIVLHRESEPAPATDGLIGTIELVGQDRPGILRAVSEVFTAHGVNVEELTSERVSAPMGGGTLFQAKATVLVPSRETLTAVRVDLEKLAADLMIHLSVETAHP